MVVNNPSANSRDVVPEGATVRRPSKPLDLMTDEERLAALKEWAEDKKYVRPGEAGTLPVSGPGGINALVFGGPLGTVIKQDQSSDRWAGQYDAPVGPPSYHTTQQGPSDTSSRNPFKKWFSNRKKGKTAKPNNGPPAYAD